jgi:hypothetical protein
MHPGARASLAAGIHKTGLVAFISVGAFIPIGAPMGAHAHTTSQS